MKDVLAVIPARSGSKGVPHKNIAPVEGHPLLAFSIAAAKLAGIERVIISTDSIDYAQIATKYGGEVPFLRPEALATDSSTDSDFMVHLLRELSRTEGQLPDLVVHLRPTSPLRKVDDVSNAIEVLRNTRHASSLRSAHRAVESPFKWFCRDENGFFVGVDPRLTPSDVNRPRQEFPPVFIPNGSVDVLRSQQVLSTADLHGDRMLVYETEALIEIDERFQLEELQRVAASNGSPLKDFLDNFELKPTVEVL